MSTCIERTDLNLDYLCEQARWIRDVLDQQVAVDGQDALHSDDILTLDELLRKLLDSSLTLNDIKVSRMHLAVNVISGMATRWPKKLIDRCDAIKDKWEAQHCPLSLIGTPLYEPGGRLHGICKPEDTEEEKLLVKWLKSPLAKLSPAVARKSGDLGFKAGDWWINALFAHRAGIIDSPNNDGGIVSDAHGAYAVVLTDGDEVDSTDPEHFKYRARSRDAGRYRLTAATPGSRQPVRILRSHTLHSFWKPRAGLRYDGLYKVLGWTWKKNPKSNEVVYTIEFKRLPGEVSMETVLRRPWTDEIEDYTEYKRLRELHQDQPLQEEVPKPKTKWSIDGAIEIYEDEKDLSPFQETFTERLRKHVAVRSKRRALSEMSQNAFSMYTFERASGLH